ncbi:small subunit processome component 20 homolog [Phymastichus coffea]|uniref:small subunit processome component 20 homolog n=1 Tax=Phymastichus coffea TaxID=108790 RepID=UPI00273C0B7F|nr:small subunit processome component 20 homolog [Phymastichus coffea]
MKTKPTRHKETNTFKFKPFSERVDQIDVDVFHKVNHRNEEVSDEAESYFHQCLQKWNFLNLSENYINLRKEVANVITLPQLLNRKQFVIDTLLKYLKLKDPLCLQSVLELIISLAKDLQADFYNYFPNFLEAIIDLLHTNHAEQLEQAFTALAYLFKFLWRYMRKNIGIIFNLLVPLLADTKPAYINNFAAESFAFVVRKVQNKEAFIKLVLTAVDKNQNGAVGCGKLLFYVLVGLPGQFHSCAESMLTVYLEALQNSQINQDLLQKILFTLFDCIVKEIHPQKCDILWTVISKMIDKFSDKSLIILLKLIQTVINHKGGKMMKDVVFWARKLAELIDKYHNNQEILMEVINVSVAIFIAPNINMLQETSSFLILKLLSIDNQDLILKLAEMLIPYSSFETLVLPAILKKSMFASLSEEQLKLLVKIIEVKSSPSLDGISLGRWKKYGLKIQGDKNIKFLSETLDSLNTGEIKENALRVLILLPHLTNLQEQLSGKLTQIIVSLYKRLFEKSNTQSKINFAFLLAIECAIHTIDAANFRNLLNEFIIKDEILSIVKEHENDLSILNAVDLILSYLKNSKSTEDYINQINFDNLHELLAPKLGSPNPLIRLTTSHLFSLFSYVPNLTHESNDPNVKNAIELPYLAESEAITIQTYRQRLLLLQALEFSGASINHLNSKYYDIPLHYLFGNLYVNFSLLWKPVSQIIASYATKECPHYWPVFLVKLKSEEITNVAEAPNFECEILSKLAAKVFAVSDKIDHDNYNQLLWKIMGLTTSYCEVKNRDYVHLFIDFVENNFFKSNSADAKSCNIKKKERQSLAEDNKDDSGKITMKNFEMELDEKNDEESKKTDEDQSNTKNAEETYKVQFGRTERIKLLLAMLEVFGKFTNTRSLYREPEILKIYLELLSSKNYEIQRAALTCLYTYKYKYLLPYKDHLDNIVTEKNLKNELTRFHVSVEEGAVLQQEHREGLMPILMRILHAKMSQRVGMRTGGKAGGIVRRKTILRFLAGIKEDEMMLFVRMAFKPFENHLPILNIQAEERHDVDLVKMVHDVISNINLETIVPPKRLQSAVNLLSIMIEQFGGKMTKILLPHLLAILICILAQVAGILSRSLEVHPGHLTIVRNVRNNCINALARFFTRYENYDWSNKEIDALLDVAVFPWIDKLPIEAIHSPTPLLKMLAAWAYNPRYYPLFVKLNKNEKTPLVFMIQLLLGAKTHKSVQNTILDMIEKMLTLQDYEKEDAEQMEIDEEKSKSLIHVVDNKLNIIKNDAINYGSAMLLPHVTDILAYVERQLKRHVKQGATRTELTILSRISEFANDPVTCDTLLTLVLPILHRKSNDSEEVVVQLLTTVMNLAKRVEKPVAHLRPIQHLLAQISAAPPRKMLMQVLDVVCKGDIALQKNLDILVNLNAYDKRWIDQPDFEKRLDAFMLIDQMIEINEVSLDLGVAVILNCFFFLKTENDLAMRDRSGHCLKLMGVHLAKKFNENNDRKFLIEDTIISLLRHGIRSKNENVKMQSIAFLGHMAMECPESHLIFRDLNHFTNKQDPEVDFFENMQHLQLHRRARALDRFCKIAKTLEKALNPRTLTQFIMPLATSYLCNERFTGKNSLIDSAIEAVGVVCKLLPWNQYEIILRHYLDKLRISSEFQKQIIRIVVAILDSFHFDISKYKEIQNSCTSVAEKNVLETESDKLDSEKIDETLKPQVPESITEKVEAEEITEENLLEALNEDSNNEIVAETIEELAKIVPAYEKQTILSPYMTKRLVFSLTKGLLPQLHRSIATRTRHEGSHKANKKSVMAEQEEEELMRIPIALAMIKLLQKLPSDMLEANLRGIFMKICTFLKSRLESVRRTTREILEKIMVTLGPDYLHYLLKEMNALLTRGYQVHVLSFTMHAVLVCLKPFLKPQHMRSNLQHILSVCKIDLFGLSAEEKEIAGIVKSVSEARSTKSFDIHHIFGEFVDQDCLIKVMVPLKEVLSRARSHKTVRKATECLRQLGLGLADNKFIDMKHMLTFLHGITSQSIPQLMPENKKKQLQEAKKENNKKSALYQRPDIFLIAPPTKNRMGIKAEAKSSRDTNDHVLVEFGMRLFHILLKRDKVNDPECKTLLDCFVPVLSDCLISQHVKLSTLALQCLNWILKMDLPQVHAQVTEICKSIFAILRKYPVAGLSKGDTYDLVMAAFKTMSVLVRDVKHHELTPEQLTALLLYAEQDLHESDRQATAFSLLRAIIYRKLVVPEMHSVMEKVADLSVTSELENVRKSARAVFYSYLMDYPLGKKLEEHITFYVAQLEYERQPGRLSTIEMIYSIVSGFPPKVLVKHSKVIFCTVALRLVNDEDTVCKKACGRILQELIDRLSHDQRKKLYDMVIDWLKSKKLVQRRLGAQVCGIFVTVEKEKFQSKLDNLLPLLARQFLLTDDFEDDNEPGQFVRIKKQVEGIKKSETLKDERLEAHHLFFVLKLLMKLSANCSAFLKSDHIDTFAEHSQSLLGHSHLWVRLAAAQFLGFILASLDIDKIIRLLNNPAETESEEGFIYYNPVEKLKSLILDFTSQLQPDVQIPGIDEFYDQVIKNLVFIARLLKISSPKQKEQENEDNENDGGNQLTLLWLMKKLRKSINFEVSTAPKSTEVRSSVFKWMAGVIATINIDLLRPILFHFMSPLVRELETKDELNAPLRHLAKDVAMMIKKKMSVDEYTQLLNQAQRRLDSRRAERKKVRSQQYITDPELAAKRKIAKQQKKKEAKKRKMDNIKGKKNVRKRAKKEVDMEE